MTDIYLDHTNDLLLREGQIFLVEDIEVLVRQRILNKLRAFTGTLFTNINYGINASLVFAKGTSSLLDQDIKTLIANTAGVVKLISYTSQVNEQRVYTSSFEYKIETGEIVGVNNVPISGGILEQALSVGIWKDGVWDYSSLWDDEEIWGGVYVPPTIPNNVFTINGIYLTNNGSYLTNSQQL